MDTFVAPPWKWGVGFSAEPLTFTVTPELNEQYLFSTQSYLPAYVGDARDSTPIACTGLLLNMSNPTKSASYTLPEGIGGLHGTEHCKFHSQAYVGETLTVTWDIDNYYRKRGRIYTIFDVRVFANDRLILRRQLHETYAVGDDAEEPEL